MKILVLNAGSSTYKSSLFVLGSGSSHGRDPVWTGLVDFGLQKTAPPRDAVKKMLLQCPFLNESSDLAFIGHRVVHGGDKFSQPVRIDAKVKKAIRNLFELAPLHNPANLQGIEIMEKLFPSVPQVAVFDTAFHSSLAEKAYTYPIPKHWRQMGIRRFGFHGISHEYCSHRAAELLKTDINKLKIITCHLGNGASLAAVKGGRSIDTTMGFTPLEGLMMGTRSGSIDPAIPLYLGREHKLTPAFIEQTLNDDSGMKGICGFSDFRQLLLLKKKGNRLARLAFDMYVHSLRRNIGAMVGVLGGLDALVFTAGIGENSSEIREEVCQGFRFLGLALDSRKNTRGQIDSDIAKKTSAIRVLVIHTREDWAIAQACATLMQNSKKIKQDSGRI